MARRQGKRWSRQVTQISNALDLESGIFSWDDPRRIARAVIHAKRPRVTASSRGRNLR